MNNNSTKKIGLRSFCTKEFMREHNLPIGNSIVYTQLSNSWQSVYYKGFRLRSCKDVMFHFNISEQELQERLRTRNTLAEVLDDLQVMPGSVGGRVFYSWQDIVDIIGVDEEILLGYLNKGHTLEHARCEFGLGVISSNTDCFNVDFYRDKDGLQIADLIKGDIKLSFEYRHNKKYFDSVTAVMSLCRTSMMSYQDVVKIFKKAQQNIQNYVRYAIYADKRFSKCDIDGKFLKCDNCTLTRQHEVVYVFSWVAMEKDEE